LVSETCVCDRSDDRFSDCGKLVQLVSINAIIIPARIIRGRLAVVC
jgi:hypothetical protein